MVDKLIRIEKVMEKTGLRRTTLYKLMRQGKFPANIHLSSKTVAWIDAEIDKWVEDRKACKSARNMNTRAEDATLVEKKAQAEKGCNA